MSTHLSTSVSSIVFGPIVRSATTEDIVVFKPEGVSDCAADSSLSPVMAGRTVSDGRASRGFQIQVVPSTLVMMSRL